MNQSTIGSDGMIHWFATKSAFYQNSIIEIRNEKFCANKVTDGDGLSLLSQQFVLLIWWERSIMLWGKPGWVERTYSLLNKVEYSSQYTVAAGAFGEEIRNRDQVLFAATRERKNSLKLEKKWCFNFYNDMCLCQKCELT